MSNSLFGMDIVISPDRPKMTLAKDVCVSPEFRKEIDAWMLEFFGTTNMIPDGQFYVMDFEKRIVMNPRSWAKVRLAL